MDELELDLVEVERLLGQTNRRFVKGRLLLALKELQEVRGRPLPGTMRYVAGALGRWPPPALASSLRTAARPGLWPAPGWAVARRRTLCGRGRQGSPARMSLQPVAGRTG
jgi:hypothetical protein